ncbi:MAG: response regulator [Verrucomicrobia bacterium]|nr:response regulator [Verrucomicrobiota bacterium]
MKLSAATPGHFHLLVIEDAPQDFELIEHELQQGGLQFSSKRIDTLEELSRELHAQPPSVVLCDHGNARLDSFTVLDIVRAHSKALPFIVVTGSLDEVQVANVFERGADDCVLKHRLADLVPAVQFALRLGEARQKLAAVTEERDRLRAEFDAWRFGHPRRPTAVPICAGCKKIREPHGDWQQLELYFRDHFNIGFSHGLCPHCMKEYSGGRA